MKRLHIIAGLALLGMLCAYACKRALENQPLKDTKARTVLACSFETLSGDITSNRTLSASTIYQLSGCVTVKSPATLTIPAGTVIQGIKSASSPAWLVVERGAKIMATGTSTNPVIFTSDQTAGSRNPGDWGGIVILGNANNNNGNSLDIPLTCATYTGGGTNNADNSGTMQFVQVLFAGKGASNDITKAGLILNSVGTGTTIDHIQLAEMANDALAAYGGAVKLSNIVSYNTDRTDYRISFGNTSNMQFLSALRLVNGASPSAAAYAMDISAQKPVVSGISNPPLTKPIISNLTVQGPNYCTNTTVNSNFKYAVQFDNNGAGKIFNSVLSSWNTGATQSGLFIDGTGSIGKTASDELEFSYNSFHNSGTTPYNSSTWTGGCDATMQDWLEGTGSASCIETGNQLSVSTLGYNSSFCGSFCQSFTSNFTLGSSSLSAADFSWDSGSQFAHVNYRGAWGATDWTQSWTEWCPPSKVYCQ